MIRLCNSNTSCATWLAGTCRLYAYSASADPLAASATPIIPARCHIFFIVSPVLSYPLLVSLLPGLRCPATRCVCLLLQPAAQRGGQLQPCFVTQILSDFRCASMRTHPQPAISAWRPASACHTHPVAIHFTTPPVRSGTPLKHHHIALDHEGLVIAFAVTQCTECPRQQSCFQPGKWQDQPVTQ